MKEPIAARIPLTPSGVNSYRGDSWQRSRKVIEAGEITTQPQEITMETQTAMQMAEQHREHSMNGMDLDKMTQTVAALKGDPMLAQFQFRARNQWIDGGENRSTIKDFYGAGAEDTSRTKPFVFTNGEPPVLLGSNEGANPVEFLLHALAGCVTTTTVLHAAARGIRIESISTELIGDIDLQGLLALDDSVAPGYRHIQVKMDIKANCSDEELDDLLRFAQQHSPVCNTVCRPVPVTVERVPRR